MKKSLYSVADTFGLNVPPGAKCLGQEDEGNLLVPAMDPDYVFDRDQLQIILTFLRIGQGKLLWLSGPTGSGKTSLIEQVCARLNWPLVQITANEQLEVDTLVGQFAPSKDGKLQWLEGVLPQAMQQNAILLIDEMDLATLTGLNGVIEGKPLTIAMNGGQVVFPTEGFRIIATANTGGSGDDRGRYHRRINDKSFEDRKWTVEVPYTKPEIEIQVLERKVPKMPKVVLEKFLEVATEIRKLFIGEDGRGLNAQLDTTLSTRVLIEWATLTAELKAADAPIRRAFEVVLLNRLSSVERIAIEKIADTILGGSDLADKWGRA